VVWFRRQAGLTQGELADRIGMNRVILSKIERGHRLPRLDVILKLVAGLEVKNLRPGRVDVVGPGPP
jgi:transcriptional regulator with XRE-family HTH domain